MGNKISTVLWFCFLPPSCLCCPGLLLLYIYGLSKTQEEQLDGWKDGEMKLQIERGLQEG